MAMAIVKEPVVVLNEVINSLMYIACSVCLLFDSTCYMMYVFNTKNSQGDSNLMKENYVA